MPANGRRDLIRRLKINIIFITITDPEARCYVICPSWSVICVYLNRRLHTTRFYCKRIQLVVYFFTTRFGCVSYIHSPVYWIGFALTNVRVLSCYQNYHGHFFSSNWNWIVHIVRVTFCRFVRLKLLQILILSSVVYQVTRKFETRTRRLVILQNSRVLVCSASTESLVNCLFLSSPIMPSYAVSRPLFILQACSRPSFSGQWKRLE